MEGGRASVAVPYATEGREQRPSGRSRRVGREQRKRSRVGHARKSDPERFYRYRREPIRPGEYHFELTLLRGRRALRIPLGTLCEEFGWVDEQAVLSGDLTLRRPDPLRRESLPIGRGHRIRCRVRRGDGWYVLWIMRVQGEPETNLTEGTLAVALADDLALLDADEHEWHFRKDKRHPNGWTADQITRHVARRLGVKLGRVARGKHRIKKLKRKTTGLNILRAAWAKEADDSARRFVIRMRDARLDVVPFNRNRIAYVFGYDAEDATVTRSAKAKPVTVIEGHARIGKGKDAKKITYTYRRDRVVRRFGRVKREQKYGRVDSRAELHRKVKRDYAKGLKVKPTVALSSPGVPWVRRGDCVVVPLRGEGISGDHSFMFTTRVAHRVSAESGYTMEVEANTVDPFEKDRERRERELRAKKRKERKRKKRDG